GWARRKSHWVRKCCSPRSAWCCSTTNWTSSKAGAAARPGYTARPTSQVVRMSSPVRLARRVVELTGCSRNEAEQYIQGGWVTVDGVVIELPQHPVTVEQVALSADARLEAVEPATLLLHKPAGLDPVSASAVPPGPQPDAT